jgi:hypothetical protein
MVGTNTYDVCIVFKVEAAHDDEALSVVVETIAHNTIYNWDWIYTTINKGEYNE